MPPYSASDPRDALPALATMLAGSLDATPLIAWAKGRPLRACISSPHVKLHLWMTPSPPSAPERTAARCMLAADEPHSAVLALHPAPGRPWTQATRAYLAARLPGRLMPVELVDAEVMISDADELVLSADPLECIVVAPTGIRVAPLLVDAAAEQRARISGLAWWQATQRLVREAA